MALRHLLFLVAFSCPPEASTTPTAAPAASPATRGAAAQPAPVQRPTAPKAYTLHKDGLRFVVRQRLTRLPGGLGLEISVEADATDHREHVLHGLSNGLAFNGIRFGKNVNGGMPLGEMGEPRRYGRVSKGRRLTLRREFPGHIEPGTAWAPLGPDTSLVLGLRTWHTTEAGGRPQMIEIAAVTVVTDAEGKASVEIARPKDQ